jgi:Transcriptional regulator
MTATRRRGTALEDAILDAGWEQLIEQGYAGFTFEAVAERAKTGKAALYRRWPDKESLLLAVLAHWGFGTPSEIAATGSLRQDVIALLRHANRFGDSIAALFSTVLGAYFDETSTTLSQLRARLLGDRALAMNLIIERAVARGELAATPPLRVVTLPVDLLRHEFLMNLQRVPEETIIDIVDTVFLPLVLESGPERGAIGRAE